MGTLYLTTLGILAPGLVERYTVGLGQLAMMILNLLPNLKHLPLVD
jgi:hypothetical protein